MLVQGIEVGNHIQFEEMDRVTEGYDNKLVIDKQICSLRDLKEAYKYAWNQRHFAKLYSQIAVSSLLVGLARGVLLSVETDE